MITESPLIQELWAERSQAMILAILKRRFGSIPAELSQQLRKIQSGDGLEDLNVHAAICSDLTSFHKQLESIAAIPTAEPHDVTPP